MHNKMSARQSVSKTRKARLGRLGIAAEHPFQREAGAGHVDLHGARIELGLRRHPQRPAALEPPSLDGRGIGLRRWGGQGAVNELPATPFGCLGKSQLSDSARRTEWMRRRLSLVSRVKTAEPDVKGTWK